MDRDDPAYRGQSDYTRQLLLVYDRFVLGFVAWFVWRCPTSRLVEGYRKHIRNPHLDVGPGTGYFLERSGLPVGSRVTILDPNPNVLEYAARRLQHLDLTVVEADVLKPLPVDGPFDSAALHLVIHCLPGPLARKAAAVANVAAVLSPTGILFGATVLGAAGPQTWLSRRVLAAFNRRGAFDNRGDTEGGLREILLASFDQVEVETVGSVAIFAARNPRAAFADVGEAMKSRLASKSGGYRRPRTATTTAARTPPPMVTRASTVSGHTFALPQKSSVPTHAATVLMDP